MIHSFTLARLNIKEDIAGYNTLLTPSQFLYTAILHKVYNMLFTNLALTGKGIVMTSFYLLQSSATHPWTKTEAFNGYLDEVTVNLMAPCEEKPHHGMDEHYQIKVSDNTLLMQDRQQWKRFVKKSACQAQ